MLQDEFWITLDHKIKVWSVFTVYIDILHIVAISYQDGDIAFVKELITKKELKMEETNTNGQNLLMLAAMHGQYELVATAINLGADLDKMDTTEGKMTALKYSQQKGFGVISVHCNWLSVHIYFRCVFPIFLNMNRFLDIEELLQMNMLKTELGRRIEVRNICKIHSLNLCISELIPNYLNSTNIQEVSGSIVRTNGATRGFYQTLGMLIVYADEL